MENAIKKAKEYYNLVKIPTLATDDELELDGIPKALQPGTHTRRINGECRATDEEMLQYYIGIINKYGENGKLNGRWKKTIVIALNDREIKSFEYNVEKVFLNKICKKSHQGWPLDSISFIPELNKYTVQLTLQEKEELDLKYNNKLEEFYKENLLKQ